MINIQFPGYFWSTFSFPVTFDQYSVWILFINIQFPGYFWSVPSLDTFDQFSVCWILLINIRILLSARHGVVSLLLPILTAGRVWRMKVVPKSLLAHHLFLNNPAANKLRFSRRTDILKIVLMIPQGMRGSDLLCNEDCPLITPSCQSLGPPTQPPSWWRRRWWW